MKNKKTIEAKQNVPQKFKEEVAVSLKHYGIGFPITEIDTTIYEKLFGDTNFELPDELKDPITILQWGEIKYNGVKNYPKQALAMAAREGSKNIPEDILKKMEDDRRKADAKRKK